MPDSDVVNKLIDQLVAKTDPGANDLLVIEDSSDTKKITLEELADAVLDRITTKLFSVNGANQTLINALTDINNQTTVITLPTTSVASSNDIYALYDARSNGESFRQRIIINNPSFDDLPAGAAVLEGYRNSANYGWIQLHTYAVASGYGPIYINVKSNGDWSGWKLSPLRSEIDTLNSNSGMKTSNNGTFETIFGQQSGSFAVYITDKNSKYWNGQFDLVYGTSSTVTTIDNDTITLSAKNSSGTLVMAGGTAPYTLKWSRISSLCPTRTDINNVPAMAMGSTAIEIPANSDLNNYKSWGIYYSDRAAVTNTLSNCPITNMGFILSIHRVAGSTTQVRQEIVGNTDEGITWVRKWNNSAWSDWKQTSSLNSEIKKLAGCTFITSSTDMNDLKAVGSYAVTDGSSVPSHLPSISSASGGAVGLIYVYNGTGGTSTGITTCQDYYHYPDMDHYQRYYKSGSSSWSDWVKLPTRSEVDAINSNKLDSLVSNTPISDCDTLLNGVGYTSDTALHKPEIYSLITATKIGANTIHQSAYGITTGTIYSRLSTNGGSSWTNWIKEPTREEITTLDSNTSRFVSGVNAANDNVDTLINNGLYYVSKFASNLPVAHGGAILSAGLSTQRVVQIFFDASDWTIYMRFYNSGESTPFTAWHQITSA